MKRKIILFGAGATGRGHVGLLAWQAGYEMVFVEKKPELVKALHQAGCYRVKLYGQDPYEVEVSGYRVYASADRQTVAREIVDADLVLTAVFDQNLPDVAVTLAEAVKACLQAGRTKPLNVIACENMMDSSSTLGKHVMSHLQGEDLAYSGEIFGFPDCMISRVVPRPDPDPLVIVTENYNEWTARREAFKGVKPAGLDALELVDNQTARLERKLFIHNGGHAVCGYFGFHRGHRYIHEALSDSLVVEHVLGALDELGEVVRHKHCFSPESIDAYKKDLGQRGAIAEMKDEVLRVVRDPIRKLSPRERLLAPALYAEAHDLPRQWIVRGITAMLKYRHPADPQSLLLAEKIERQGLASTLQEVCDLAPASPLETDIMTAWKEWK
jgi:mannitol-1-phosphate 5-dehydrogenase